MAGLRDDFKSMLDKRKAVLNAGTLEGEEKIANNNVQALSAAYRRVSAKQYLVKYKGKTLGECFDVRTVEDDEKKMKYRPFCGIIII